MKKLIALLLALVMVFALCACGGGKTETSTDTPKTDTPKTDTPKTDTPKTDTPKTDTPAAPPAVSAEPQVLRVAFRGDPNSLCHVITAVASANTPAHQLMMDRLFEYDYTTGSVTPMLATGWEAVDATQG